MRVGAIWLVGGIALVLGLTSQTISAEEVSTLPSELVAAEVLYRQEGPEAAQAEFARLASLYAQSGPEQAHATAVRFIGEIHWRLGEYPQAETELQQALKLSRAAHDKALEAKVQNVLGLLYWDLGDYPQALASFESATTLAESIGDRRMQGAILNNTALVHDEQGDYRRSLAEYQQVLDLYEGQDFLRGEGDTLGNIGGVHLLLGEYRQAEGQYVRALAISEELDDITAMSQDHGNLALSRLGLGDAEGALQHFDHAITLSAEAGLRQDEAYWQRGKANALIRQGRFEQGLNLHRTAVETYQQIGSLTEAVEAMHDLGALYLVLGDPASAESWYERSMATAREIGLSRGVTVNQLSLGDLQARREATEEADALYRQAWQRARESGEMALSVEALLRLSGLHRNQQRLDEAENEARQARDIANGIEATAQVAEADYHLAEIDRIRGNLAPAIERYTFALDTLPAIADPELAWPMHYGKGLALAAAGDSLAAIEELLQAVTVIEGVRDRLLEQRFRAGYVQDKFQVYADLVRLQMEVGKAEDAFSTAERLRARSYLDLVEGDLQVPADNPAATQEIELRERIRQLRKAIGEESVLPVAEQRQLALAVYSEELMAAERAYQALLDDRRRLGAGKRVFARTPTYQEVRDHLQEGEGLIEYVVGEDRVMMFVLTREGILAITGDMGSERLRSRVELLRDLIRRPGDQRWERPAAGLAGALIEPLERAGALRTLDHLYIVPHSTLNYLPFALLPANTDGSRLMLDEYTLAYLPTAAALLEAVQPAAAPNALLAVAPSRSRLQHAPAEANAVFELFGPESRLLLGDMATETAFKQVAGDFGVLHLATHGYFNKLNPMLSGLELEPDSGNDGLLELHEILGMQLDAELVTLSACQTAMGSGHFSEIPAGDDFVGLTRAFLYAGSEAVMATLWEVDDASTAELMRQFYQRYRVPAGTPADKMGKAEALAAAQRVMRQTKEFRHPYYWAPFVLMGASRSPPGQALGA